MCFFKTFMKLNPVWLLFDRVGGINNLTVVSVCAIMHWFAEIFHTPERAFNSLVYIKDTKGWQ